MDSNKRAVIEEQIERTIKALENNNMTAVYAPTSADAVKYVQDFLVKGETISCGGSVTLFESGVMDLMQSGDYRFLDRTEAGITNEQLKTLYLDSFSADTYLTSSNAITEKGELYNVDGSKNRIAAMNYGPKSVIVVAGYQKIVADLPAAVYRVKSIAAPANAKRIGLNTFCAIKGHCVALHASDMTAGCDSAARICCGYSILAKQNERHKGRIKVILVGEELGY